MTPQSYKSARESLGLTQEQLAELVGVSVRTIASRESGQHAVSREAAIAVRSLDPAPSPDAWLHVLDTTEGIPGNEPSRVLSFDARHPFGLPKRDYSEEYGPPVSTPLYFMPNAAAQTPPDSGTKDHE